MSKNLPVAPSCAFRHMYMTCYYQVKDILRICEEPVSDFKYNFKRLVIKTCQKYYPFAHVVRLTICLSHFCAKKHRIWMHQMVPLELRFVKKKKNCCRYNNYKFQLGCNAVICTMYVNWQAIDCRQEQFNTWVNEILPIYIQIPLCST